MESEHSVLKLKEVIENGNRELVFFAIQMIVLGIIIGLLVSILFVAIV